jgi:hypothetical protein
MPSIQQTLSRLKPSSNLISALLITFVLMVGLMVINSHISRWVLSYWLEKQGAEVVIEDLRLDLWGGSLEIDNLGAVNSQGQKLKLTKLKVQWGYRMLWDKVVQVNTVTVDSLNVDIVGDKFEVQQIGPIDLVKLLASDEPTVTPESQREPSQWQVKLGPVKLNNLKVCYNDLSYQYADLALPLDYSVKDSLANQKIANCVSWKKLSLDTQLALNGPQKVRLNGQVNIGGLTVKDRADHNWLVLDELAVNRFDLAGQQLGWQSLKVNNLQLFADTKVAEMALVGAGVNEFSLDKLAFELNEQRFAFDLLAFNQLWLSQRGSSDKSHHKVIVDKLNLAAVQGTNQADEPSAELIELAVKGVKLSTIGANANSNSHIAVEQLNVASLKVGKSGADITQLAVGGVQLTAVDSDKNTHSQVIVKQLAVGTVNSDFVQAAVSDVAIDGIDVKHIATSDDKQTRVLISQLAVNTLAGSAQAVKANTIKLDGATVKQQYQKQDEHPLADVEQLTLAELEVNLKDTQATINQLMLGQTNLWQKASDSQYHRAVSLGQLDVDKAILSEQQQQLAGITLSNLGLLSDFASKKDLQSPLVSLAKLTVDDVTAGEAITVGEVILSGFDGLLTYEPKSGVNLANWLYADETAGDEKSIESSPTKSKPSKAISIKRLALIDEANLTVVDNTLDTPQTHHLSKLHVDIKPLVLTPTSPPPAAAIDFSAQIEQSGLLSLKGTVQPAAQALSMDLAGQLKHLATPHYSAYSAKHIGYRIDQGQLGIDYTIKIDNNQIDSQFEVLLRKFELAKLQQHEKSPDNSELGIPLPLALDLLRDSDDNIELSIPIKGDLNEPNFSIAGIISTVTFKALKTAVLYSYSPLSVLSIAGGLVDLATALRFKSVEFTVGATTLDANGQAQLDKVGSVLGKKAKIDLVLCANASLLDLPPEVTPPVDEKAAKNVTVTKWDENTVNKAVKVTLDSLNDEQRKGLLAIADQRQQATKAYLTQQHKIAGHRLLLCNVKFKNKADAKPEVAISL